MIPANKIKGNPSSVAMTHLPATEGHRRSASTRDKSNRTLPTSPLAAGILRQQSVATPTGSLVQRTIITNTTPLTAADSVHTMESGDSYHPVVSNEFVAVKSKPRLIRQTAVQDESSSCGRGGISYNNPNVVQTNKEDRSHPAHGGPRQEVGVWENAIAEVDEEFAGGIIFAGTKRPDERRNSQGCPQNTTCTNRDKNRLGLSFVPRKLSTIPSRSLSVNPDVEIVAERLEKNQECLPSQHAQNPTTSAHNNPKLQWSFSKSDHELYCRQRSDISQDVKGSMPLLFVVTNAPSTECQRAITGASSFEMIDDDVFQESSSLVLPSENRCQMPGLKSPHEMSEKDHLLQ